MERNKVSDFIKQFEELTKKPEKYLSLEEKQVSLVKVFTKNLYDFTKEKEYPKNKAIEVLKKLVITNLDEEQVWQQIELQNNSVCNSFVSEIAHLSVKKGFNFPLKENKKIKVNKQEIQIKPVKEKVQKKVKCSNKKSSVVDDKFFKLHEMERFLENIEKKEDQKIINDAEEDDLNDDVSSLDDENENKFYYSDFFDQPDEELCNESDKEGLDESKEDYNEKKVRFILSGEENEDESDVDLDGNEDLDNFNNYNKEDCENDSNIKEDDDDDDDDDDGGGHDDGHYDDDDDDDDDDDGGGHDDGHYDDDNDDDEENIEADLEAEETFMHPSSFEARQERLKSRIKNLEEEALKEKPWQLKGEVTANNRPQNSLLEEYVEFDIASRPAPVLTEKSTLKLEDVITQRIKDAAWDDVVRKIKPVESDVEYKKKLVLDQEKSKLSLAQIYEKEYLKQLESKNEETIEKPEKEPPEHQEIRVMMNSLFSKLDALSNFHFTPKMVAQEVKIISNVPAINMEEVAPVTTSDATLLAPEEVKPKLKGDLIGKSERTKTDKRRERRQKKLKQKIKHKKVEAKTKSKLNDFDSRDLRKKKISQKLLKKITKSSDLTQLDETEGGKYVKSSTAFFTKLQNKTRSLIKEKGQDVKKMKLGKKIPGKKFI